MGDEEEGGELEGGDVEEGGGLKEEMKREEVLQN